MTHEPTISSEEYLRARYGRTARVSRRRLPRFAVIALVALGALAVVTAGWFIFQRPVQGEESGLTVVDDTRAEVSVQVFLTAGTRGECRVVVLGEFQGEIGVGTVTVGPYDSTRTVEVTTSVATSQRAFGARIEECYEVPAQ